jgi:tetratricopeptide (TPR) repeat protein
MHCLRASSVLVLAGVVLTTGCADSSRQAAMRGPGKELAKQWAKAARQPIDIEDAKPEPEPKLLPMTHFSAGNLFEKQGSYAQAIEQYRKAVELNAGFAAAYGRLGLCYMKVGQYDRAAQALKRAADLQPASAQLCNNLGFACLAQKNYAQAESWFGKALLAKPGYARARLNMAITLVQLKRDAEALGHLLVVVPEPIAQYNLGAMQLAVGRPVEARASFERALSLQADFPAASKGLTESLARLTQLPTAPLVAPVTGQAGSAPAAAAACEHTNATPAAAPLPGNAGPTPVVAAVPNQVQQNATSASLQHQAPPPGAGASVHEQARAGPATRPIVGADDEPVMASGPAGRAPPQPSAGIAVGSAPPEAPAGDSLVLEIAPFQLAGDFLTYSGPLPPADASAPQTAVSADAPGGITTRSAPLRPQDLEEVLPAVATLQLVGDYLTYSGPLAAGDGAAPSADAPAGITASCAPVEPQDWVLARDDAAEEAAILRAIACYLTSRAAEAPAPAADAPATVLDFDLVSLRWGVWDEGMGCMGVDVRTLSNDELQAVLAKWLCAVNELDSVTSAVWGATAYADDM